MIVNAPYEVDRGKCFVDTPLEFAAIRLVVEQDRVSPLPISAGAARFLVVGLNGIRHFKVDHKSHIGLINPHAKGIGRYHHARLALLPRFLAHVFVKIGQAGVIIERADTGRVERLRQFAGAVA